MYLINVIKSDMYDKKSTKFNQVFDKVNRKESPLHVKYVSQGVEFIDDAIRTKDQPFNNSEVNKEKQAGQ